MADSTTRRGGSVRGEVERRRGGTGAKPGGQVSISGQRFAELEDTLRDSVGWFRRVAPSHVDADRFIGLCLGVVRQADWKLQKALVESPQSFFLAAVDCASKGLIPGETFHFVPFNNKVKGQGNAPDRFEMRVTGMVDYKGEIDMIYRAGGVTSIHCDVVRRNDTFRWRRDSMRIPYHVVHGPEDAPEMEGLAEDEERGHLMGVYAYAVMIGGGFSEPVVFNRGKVQKRRAVSKSGEAFWGPEWPEEGPWTEDMWKKTVLHKLYDLVPHSAEYVTSQVRVAAALQGPGPAALGGGALALDKGDDDGPAMALVGSRAAEVDDGTPVPPEDTGAERYEQQGGQS